MTQFSMLPWETQTGTGDGANSYTQDQANNFFRYFDVRDPASEGVAYGVLDELAVSGTASPLSVASGAAICYGRYWNDAAVNLAVTTPTVGTTGGRVVLRADWATNTVRLFVKMSTDGNGAIPALVQTAGTTWEISLATFTITTGGVITLTDDRTFRKVTGKLGAGDIDNVSMIANALITGAKIASETIVTGNVADDQITNPKIADDAVDDTKVGNRVPQFYRREGGDGTNWNVTGTTTYTPAAVRMQGGAFQASSIGVGEVGVINITFPTAFSATPLCFVQSQLPATFRDQFFVHARNITPSGMTINISNEDSGSIDPLINWLAIGPE